MIFSDLGTESAMETRGFSAYTWIRDELIRMGVPRAEIAFMQHYKKSAAKQKLFGDLNAGRKRILIGSTATMGTGVNAQQRLKALHHLDVPWLVSDIIQREGRIERQGNQHEEIELYAYAQQGSVDATNWQLLERKQRFIGLAMSGDRSIRRIEDIGGEGGNQFAMAKALASGDARLMQKAGLEADLARLERLAAAHYDDQFAVKRAIERAEREIAGADRLIPLIEADLAVRQPTRGEAFALCREKGNVTEREKAGSWLLSQVRMAAKNGEEGKWTLGQIGGFAVVCEAEPGWIRRSDKRTVDVTLFLEARSGRITVTIEEDTKGLGLVSRIEHALLRLDDALRDAIRTREEAERRLPSYQSRLGLPFAEQAMLDEKRAELKALEDDLAATSTEEEAANDDGQDKEKEETAA
ncbi:hypothetical protein GGR01_003248 [Acetobacter oeni]|nr:hypothetical protein [Acetobacter oeni]